MEILKNVITILFFIVSISLIILSLSQAKQDDGAQTILEGSTDSYYGKNKGDSKESKMTLAISILFIVFIGLVILLQVF